MLNKPVILVLFGITGDLAQRKLLPAIYHLFKEGTLHKDSVVLGISRRDVTADELLEQVELCVNEVDKICDPEGLKRVQKALRMHTMDLGDGAAYDKLRALLDDIEASYGSCMDRLYYLSVPPQSVQQIVPLLGSHSHNSGCSHGMGVSRLLLEKPFGHDLASAEALIAETAKHFSDEQQFRVDHYVAKQTVQDIPAFRRDNPLFATIWNNRHIASIDIVAYETLSIEGRAAFYEGVGALRDFLQNHLLQVLAYTTMELPAEADRSDGIHAAKRRLLDAVIPISAAEVGTKTRRGQYQGYRQEADNPGSITETYASLDLQIDNDTWRGVPLRIASGKAMAEKRTEVTVRFKPTNDGPDMQAGNCLVFHIQPENGISLQLQTHTHDFSDELRSVVVDFNDKRSADSDEAVHTDAYERVLMDAVAGDHSLFVSAAEVLASWRVVEQVVQTWSASGDDLVIYKKGSVAV